MKTLTTTLKKFLSRFQSKKKKLRVDVMVSGLNDHGIPPATTLDSYSEVRFFSKKYMAGYPQSHDIISDRYGFTYRVVSKSLRTRTRGVDFPEIILRPVPNPFLTADVARLIRVYWVPSKQEMAALFDSRMKWPRAEFNAQAVFCYVEDEDQVWMGEHGVLDSAMFKKVSSWERIEQDKFLVANLRLVVGLEDSIHQVPIKEPPKVLSPEAQDKLDGFLRMLEVKN